MVFHYWGLWLHQARKRNLKWDAAAYERLPLACLGGPIFSVSLFWLVGFPLLLSFGSSRR